jgi:hypothetical protein
MITVAAVTADAEEGDGFESANDEMMEIKKVNFIKIFITFIVFNK